MRFSPWAGCFADSLQPLEILPSCCVCSSLSSHTSILPPPARQNPVPSPTFLPAHLRSLYWAHEGEPVPSGTTVQIAVLPPQMDASLLRIPRERVGALHSSTFCLVVVVSNHNACPRLSLTVDIQGSGLHCAA